MPKLQLGNPEVGNQMSALRSTGMSFNPRVGSVIAVPSLKAWSKDAQVDFKPSAKKHKIMICILGIVPDDAVDNFDADAVMEKLGWRRP